MTPFATKLVEEQYLSNREGHTLSDIEFDYRQRLQERSYLYIETACTEEEREAVFGEVIAIIAFAQKQARKTGKATTYLQAATGQMYRMVTLQWFFEIESLLGYFLTPQQLAQVKRRARKLYLCKGGRGRNA